jgi:hypothetical protein
MSFNATSRKVPSAYVAVAYEQDFSFILDDDALNADRLAPRQTPKWLKHESAEQYIKHLLFHRESQRFAAFCALKREIGIAGIDGCPDELNNFNIVQQHLRTVWHCDT